MKKSKIRTRYITVLRYIFRGTLAFSIYGMFRAIGVYDVTNQSFGLTMLKVLYCGAVMGLSVWALIMIDGYFARRIDRMKTRDVARAMVFQSCKHCSYHDNPNKCEYTNGNCQKGIEQWLNERV